MINKFAQGRKAAIEAERFNQKFSVGGVCYYFPTIHSGLCGRFFYDHPTDPIKLTILAPAQVSSGQIAVVKVDDVRGWVACSHVRREPIAT